MSEQKLINIGFTNEYQVKYATEENCEATFYPDSDNGCYIPVYMLEVHAHRAGSDSKIFCNHLNLQQQLSRTKAELEEARAMISLMDSSTIRMNISDECEDWLDRFLSTQPNESSEG